jgi:hypothetical protein
MTDTLNRTRNILYIHDYSNLDDFTSLYTPEITDYNYKPQGYKYSGYITDLRLNVKITSIAEAKLPQIPLGATKTDKFELIREYEYNNPHFLISIELQSQGVSAPLAKISLQNRQPHYQVNLLNYITDQPSFVVSPDSVLGVRFIDTVYGLPVQTDEIVIYGCVVEETTLLPENNIITGMQTYNRISVTTTPVKVLDSNPYRKNVLFRNISEHDVYLGYSQGMTTDEGIILKEGWFYEMNASNLYKGDIYAMPSLVTPNEVGAYRLSINEMF